MEKKCFQSKRNSFIFESIFLNYKKCNQNCHYFFLHDECRINFIDSFIDSELLNCCTDDKFNFIYFYG